MMTLRKPRYHVDLIGLQALCESNYWKLLKLMPCMHEEDEHRIVVDAGDGYPNEQMLQPDEKFQLNQFLGEWLGYCQRNGQSAQPLSIAGQGL